MAKWIRIAVNWKWRVWENVPTDETLTHVHFASDRNGWANSISSQSLSSTSYIFPKSKNIKNSDCSSVTVAATVRRIFSWPVTNAAFCGVFTVCLRLIYFSECSHRSKMHGMWDIERLFVSAAPATLALALGICDAKHNPLPQAYASDIQLFNKRTLMFK